MNEITCQHSWNSKPREKCLFYWLLLILKRIWIHAIFLFANVSRKWKWICNVRKQVSNCLWMAPWGQKRGVIKGSPRGHQGVTEPRGTRRTWGNRCAHRLGHSDGFRCVCACVCQIHETAPLNVCIYSNKAIQMVIRYGIFQYVTKLQCT